ncbi:MAG: hypothetical protein ABJN40_22965 [Sneathiella sp.]
MTALEWGAGRSQIFAMRSEIEDALKKGSPVSVIYREFVAAGKFKGSQSTFAKQVSKIKKALKSAEDTPVQRPEQLFPDQKPQSDKPALPGTFSHSALPSSDDTDW